MKTPKNLTAILLVALAGLFFATSCTYKVYDNGPRHEYVYKNKPKKAKKPKKPKKPKKAHHHDNRPGGHHRH